MNNTELLEQCIQLVKLYAQCTGIEEELVPLLQFTPHEKTSHQTEIFQVVLQQIVMLHDHVATSADWNQLTHRLLLSSLKNTKSAAANPELQQLITSLSNKVQDL